MAHLLFVFLDGVGIGVPDATRNPFVEMPLPHWRRLTGGGWPTLDAPGPLQSAEATVMGAEATLGVDGVPQSGTGTTTLLTGINAAAALGRHEGPYPAREIRPLLRRWNLLSRAAAAGLRPALANAYPPFYFERLARGKARRTTCTQAALGAGVRLRSYDDLVRGDALSPWLTNARWRRLSSEAPLISPEQAGANLAGIARGHDVTLFEFFATDHRGHRHDLARARLLLAELDAFLGGVLDGLDPAHDLLVVASDHGNFEAQEHGHHTTHPTLLTLRGRAHDRIAGQVSTIAQIVPALVEWLGIDPTASGPAEEDE